MNLPNVFVDDCPAAARSCESPELVGELVLQPEYSTVCAPVEILFRVILRAITGDVDISQGVTFQSSDTAVVTIESVGGKATAVGAGIATITATWQDLQAFAQINVLGVNADCCDGVEVLTAIALDNSQSMGQAYGAGFASKLEAGKALVRAYMEAKLDKDSQGLLSFHETPLSLAALGSSVADLTAALLKVPTTEKKTNLAQVFEQALVMVGFAEGTVASAAESTTPVTAAPVTSAEVSTLVATQVTQQLASRPEPKLHGDGPPAPTLGTAGDTYVDDLTGAFYWKTETGWNPPS